MASGPIVRASYQGYQKSMGQAWEGGFHYDSTFPPFRSHEATSTSPLLRRIESPTDDDITITDYTSPASGNRRRNAGKRRRSILGLELWRNRPDRAYLRVRRSPCICTATNNASTPTTYDRIVGHQPSLGKIDCADSRWLLTAEHLSVPGIRGIL